ncbi:prenyltransferase/squalene oxidase repeat-containing protein [Micromonospora sp. LOL_023]|uniref:prenyltransferase/squalene oxidase repeat-containing protein n=1 Tax=Micromonospora sp. LOL_023 TaxID=3345418 RepID=UPI003A896C3F
MTVTEGWTRSEVRAAEIGWAGPGARPPSRWKQSAQELTDELSGRHRTAPVVVRADPAATTVHDQASALATLLRADISLLVSPDLIDSLRAALAPAGAAPASAQRTETIALVIHTLALLGQPTDQGVLLDLSGGGVTVPAGHDTPVTAARLLDALGAAGDGRRYYEVTAARGRISAWLCDRQRPDGSWHDRRHTSPHFTTAACALALHDAGVGARASAAVLRAVDWVLRTQRPGGAWGLRYGTAEETAYALLVLLATTDPPSARMARSAGNGAAHLTPADEDPSAEDWQHSTGTPRPAPLPAAQASIVAAGHLAQKMAVNAVDGHGCTGPEAPGYPLSLPRTVVGG